MSVPAEEIHPVEVLTREEAIAQNTDPTGRRWVIKNQRGSSLLIVRPDPDRKDAQIPAIFSGEWTGRVVLEEKIKIWLNRQWDASELASLKAERKVQVAKEATPEPKPPVAKKKAKSKSQQRRLDVQTKENPAISAAEARVQESLKDAGKTPNEELLSSESGA